MYGFEWKLYILLKFVCEKKKKKKKKQYLSTPFKLVGITIISVFHLFK